MRHVVRLLRLLLVYRAPFTKFWRHFMMLIDLTVGEQAPEVAAI